MKKISVVFLFAFTLWACKSREGAPDVSGISIEMPVHRFEDDFFAIDSMDINPGLARLQAKYPVFSGIFIHNILGLAGADSNSPEFTGSIRLFLHLTSPVYQQVKKKYRDFEGVKNELQNAFRYVNYYFPAHKAPSITTLVGPVDAMAQLKNGEQTPDFITDETIGISLQFYLGKDNPLYRDEYFVQQVAPLYRSRRFDKEYITPDVMKLVADDIYPDKSKGRPLVEQMIEKGKQWYLLDKFLPRHHDSLKTGYTGRQLEWCRDNEGLIWAYIVRNEDLNSLNPATIQAYIGEAPFTQGFSQELSPGNLGQWIGWRIVQKFATKNPDIKPGDLMVVDAKKILDEAKYKPK
jgi:hypothetical protein